MLPRLPFPFLKHLTPFPPSQSSNKPLFGPHLSGQTLWPPRFFYLKRLCRVMWRPIHVSTRAWPLHWSPHFKVSQFLEWSWLGFRGWHRDGVGGGFLHGGCVQRPGLLSKCIDMHPQPRHIYRQTSFLFGASWENKCVIQMTGEGNNINWED